MVKDSGMSQVVGKPAKTLMFWPKTLIVAASMLWSLSMAPQAFAAPKGVELETRIWTSNLNDYVAIERAATRLLQDNPGAYEHYLVAELSLRMFKNNPADLRYLKQASDMSQQAIELAPNKEYGYLVAAQVLDLMGYKNEAVEMLSERPSFAQGWRTSFVRGVLASAQDADKSSLDEFARSLKSADVSSELVGFYVANGLEASYSGYDLVTRLQSWRKQVNTAAIQMSLAKALEETGKDRDAHQILVSLNKTHPSYEAKFADAVILYSKLKDSKNAENLLLDVIANAPSDQTELRTAARSHLGKIALQKGYSKIAAQMFADAIENTGERLKWIAFSHKAYTESAKLQDFAGLLEGLKSTIPGSSYLYALQGEVLSESLSQHDKAVASFADAITLDPKRSDFYNGMGLAYYRMHENEKALATFDKALKIDPKDATARYNEACVLALMGRGDEATGSLKAAISLDGRLQNVAMQDKDFEGIRANAQFQSLMEDQDAKITKVP